MEDLYLFVRTVDSAPYLKEDYDAPFFLPPWPQRGDWWSQRSGPLPPGSWEACHFWARVQKQFQFQFLAACPLVISKEAD